MKTKSVLDKYQKLIAGLLGSAYSPADIHFLVKNKEYGPDFLPIGEQSEQKINGQDWIIGEYKVNWRDKVISTWTLYQMPHCCGIAISCSVRVASEYMNKRIGTTLNVLRQEIVRLQGYSLLLCTDVAQNEHQRKILSTNGWKDVYNFVNKRTNNRVYISVINI